MNTNLREFTQYDVFVNSSIISLESKFLKNLIHSAAPVTFKVVQPIKFHIN